MHAGVRAKSLTLRYQTLAGSRNSKSTTGIGGQCANDDSRSDGHTDGCS